MLKIIHETICAPSSSSFTHILSSDWDQAVNVLMTGHHMHFVINIHVIN